MKVVYVKANMRQKHLKMSRYYNSLVKHAYLSEAGGAGLVRAFYGDVTLASKEKRKMSSEDWLVNGTRNDYVIQYVTCPG